MSMPSADTLDRTETLYVTDAELIRRMGVPERSARAILRAFDRDPKSGFPRKDKFFGDRRYWPAVKAYLDKRNRVNMEAPIQRGLQ
jgi:hypothetical protein